MMTDTTPTPGLAGSPNDGDRDVTDKNQDVTDNDNAIDNNASTSAWRPRADYEVGTVYAYDAVTGVYTMTIEEAPSRPGGIMRLRVERSADDRYIQWSDVCYEVTISEVQMEQWLHDLDAWLVEE